MPSVSSWLNSRARLTPSAMRTAISRRRRMVRARTRLATFAQAMRSTMNVTPLSHVATRVTLDGSGPRSANTDAATARGRSSSSGVPRRLSVPDSSAAARW